MDKNDQILYHYTDFNAFNGILNDRELRVNNVLNMNDAAEMELFMRGIFNAVEKRLIDAGDEKKVLELQRMFEHGKDKAFDYSAFAACFSTYRDDASQWERYGNRGKGVCLAMRRSILEKITGGAISLLKVNYQDNVESHPLVDKLYHLIAEDSETIKLTQALRDTIFEAWRNSASYKHPSFSSEHEIRLVVMPFEDENFALEPRYHVAKDRIKKYYPLNLDKMCANAGTTIEDLITEVMIGPESTQSVPILRDYLRDLSLRGLAERISHSNCPLRSKM